MSRFNSPLDNVRVAAPCDADWASMFGNERVRFCGLCKLNVYNLSDMTKGQAEELVARSEGRLCIRYFMRNDGSIITNNCPVGLRKIKRRLSRVATAVCSSVVSFLAGVGLYGLVNRDPKPPSFPIAGQMVVNKRIDPIAPPPTVVETVGELVPMPAMGRLVLKPNVKNKATSVGMNSGIVYPKTRSTKSQE